MYWWLWKNPSSRKFLREATYLFRHDSTHSFCAKMYGYPQLIIQNLNSITQWCKMVKKTVYFVTIGVGLSGRWTRSPPLSIFLWVWVSVVSNFSSQTRTSWTRKGFSSDMRVNIQYVGINFGIIPPCPATGTVDANHRNMTKIFK